MSIVEQKFSALDSFADRYEIIFWLNKNYYSIRINKDDVELQNFVGDSADEAMTEALRYLRRINKQKPS